MSGTTSRVLVVEDEGPMAELIVLNLRHAGFEVTVVGDADQAIAEVERSLPDLVLLDRVLRGASGLHLTRRWRADRRTRRLPLIMLSARGSEADRIAVLDAGADDYVSTPFSPRELMERIRAVLRRS